jgi:hypothetical protein
VHACVGGCVAGLLSHCRLKVQIRSVQLTHSQRRKHEGRRHRRLTCSLGSRAILASRLILLSRALSPLPCPSAVLLNVAAASSGSGSRPATILPVSHPAAKLEEASKLCLMMLITAV